MDLASGFVVLVGTGLLLVGGYLNRRLSLRYARTYMAGGSILVLIGLALLFNPFKPSGPRGSSGPVAPRPLWTATSSRRPALSPTLPATLSPRGQSPQLPSATSRFPCGDALPSRLSLWETAYVSYEPELPNRLRTEPDIEDSEVVGRIQPGTTVRTILGGPQCNDGMVWWRVRVLSGSLRGSISWTSEGDANEYWLIPLEPAVMRTPGPGVLGFGPGDLILLPDEIPARYSFAAVEFIHRPNSEVLRARGEEEGSSYLRSTGRVDGVMAEFLAEDGNASLFGDLAIDMIVFESSVGPALHVFDELGPCREEENLFSLVDNDLDFGDFSMLCEGGQFLMGVGGHLTGAVTHWVRVGYRNVYFDVSGIVPVDYMDTDPVVEIAAAQLRILEAFPLSDFLRFNTTETPYFAAPSPVVTSTCLDC